MFEWNAYLIALFSLGGLFIAGVLVALRWAFRSGQLSNLDEGSRVIFTEEEPEGKMLDRFPPPRPKKRDNNSVNR